MSRARAARHLGISPRAFDLLRKDPEFPSAVQLRPTILVWSWPEIAQWLLARPRVHSSGSHADRRVRRAA
jgi:predicted DNA-binding transcriptional regulator AlpA